MAEAKPPVTAELIWSHDLVLNATSARVSAVTDGASTAGPSPVQFLAIGLAGCMSMDVIDIVRKARCNLRAFRCQLTAHRAPEHPRRFIRVLLHFHLEGVVRRATVERAIVLSHEKYCSVWHSMRQDIELSTSFDIVP